MKNKSQKCNLLRYYNGFIRFDTIKRNQQGEKKVFVLFIGRVPHQLYTSTGWIFIKSVSATSIWYCNFQRVYRFLNDIALSFRSHFFSLHYRSILKVDLRFPSDWLSLQVPNNGILFPRKNVLLWLKLVFRIKINLISWSISAFRIF